MGIVPGKEHDRRLVFGRALQVVQHVVGADVGEDLAHAGDEHDIELGILHLAAMAGHQVGFRIQHALQQFLQFVF